MVHAEHDHSSRDQARPTTTPVMTCMVVGRALVLRSYCARTPGPAPFLPCLRGVRVRQPLYAFRCATDRAQLIRS